MPLPLLITDDEHVPIYLQLVHQIRYLITSRELAADAQLPSVRTLAETLGINAGTVAQAYRVLQSEGLIDSQRGRGTFVAPLPDEAVRYSTRQALLTESIEDLVTRAFALGFDAAAIRQHLTTHLQQRVRTTPVVLVAPTTAAAEKYALLVTQALPDSLLATVIPCSIDQLEAGEPRLLDVYKRAFFTVVAFMSSVPRVEAMLSKYGVRSEIIGLTAHLTQETMDRLRKLEPNAPYALVTEARNVNSALSLLAQHSTLDLRSIRVLTELSGAAQLGELTSTYVIHTFGVTALLDRHEIPLSRRVEVAFTLSEDSYARLRHLIPSHPLPIGV